MGEHLLHLYYPIRVLSVQETGIVKVMCISYKETRSRVKKPITNLGFAFVKVMVVWIMLT